MNVLEFNAIGTMVEEVTTSGSRGRENDAFAAGTTVITGHFRRTTSAFCPRCDKPVALLSFEHSAELFKTDMQDIKFLANRGDLHRIHNRKGELMICSASLFECFDSRDTRLLDSHFEIEMQKSFEEKLSK